MFNQWTVSLVNIFQKCIFHKQWWTLQILKLFNTLVIIAFENISHIKKIDHLCCLKCNLSFLVFTKKIVWVRWYNISTLLCLLISLLLSILSLSNQMYKATITLCLTLLLSLNHLQTLNLSLLVSSSIEGNIRLDASYAMPINLILSFIFARAFKFVLWFPKLFIPAHYVKTHL